jgi:hypothetical protein
VLAGVALQALPLPKEKELPELMRADVFRQIGPGFLEVIRVMHLRRFGPLLPAAPLVRILEGHEQGVIIEPAGFLGDEAFEGRAQRAAARCLKMLPRLVQQMILEVDDRPKFDAVVGKHGPWHITRVEQTVLDQVVRADEIGIASECGKTLVRRIAESGRP